jgi:UDP-glucose 4-epimerase
MIHPDTPPAPVNAYGKSKLDAEIALRALEDDTFRVAAVRPPMVYGKGCKGNYNTLAALARKLPVFPEFDNRRSMIYVENLAELIRLIALRFDRGIFHPQDASAKSVTDIVRQICAVHQKPMRFLKILAPLVRLAGRGGIVRRAFGDMVYEQSMSDYPENYRIVGFEEAIRRTEGGSSWRA